LKLIYQTFHFTYKIQQNFTIWNGVKTLEITPILMVCHERFPTHKHGCRRGAGIKKSQQKRTFSLFRVVKNKFHHFLTP